MEIPLGKVAWSRLLDLIAALASPLVQRIALDHARLLGLPDLREVE